MVSDLSWTARRRSYLSLTRQILGRVRGGLAAVSFREQGLSIVREHVGI